MKTLAELENIAQKDDTKRKVFLVFPSGAKQVGKFVDPWMGLLMFDALPNQVVQSNQLTPFETVGMFLEE